MKRLIILVLLCLMVIPVMGEYTGEMPVVNQPGEPGGIYVLNYHRDIISLSNTPFPPVGETLVVKRLGEEL